ncbi:hypothetical protein ACE193_20840 [Bernardetia sp. OM2101]|uniref:hypothetical protein n=1 Tax=Bernardetia sp. OM2101 TaxID=3344876 RepID=UPI0035CFEE3A
MPQNQSSNKFSAIIGFLLLIAIIGFTVFVNFFVEKEVEHTKKEENKEIITQDSTKDKILVKSYFNAFNKEDVENFWKLENFKTDSMQVEKDKNITSIQLKKILLTTKMKMYYYGKDEVSFNKLNDSLEIVFQKKYGENYRKEGFSTTNPSIPSIKTHLVYYGKLEFNYQNQDNDRYGSKVFEKFKIDDSNKKLFNLTEIGDIFIKYQIRAIYNDPEVGDFTIIVLTDGKEIFLIKENTKVKAEFFEKLLLKAAYINDSTRIIFPSEKTK